MSGPPARGRPRQARSIRTREHLLDVAARLFDAHGWGGVTTNAIAREAGVSVGGLYEWFASKESVLEGLAERHLAEMADVLAARLATPPASEPSIETLVRDLVGAAAGVHAARPALHRLLYAEAPRTPRITAMSAALEEAIVAAVAPLLVADARRSPDLRARLLFRAAEALIHSFVLDDSLPIDRDARVEEVVRLCALYARTDAGADV